MGGEWPCRCRANSVGSDPGWRISTSSTAMMTSGCSEAAASAARLAGAQQLLADLRVGGEIDIDAVVALAAGLSLAHGGQ